jgi:hypothetical protein
MERQGYSCKHLERFAWGNARGADNAAWRTPLGADAIMWLMFECTPPTTIGVDRRDPAPVEYSKSIRPVVAAAGLVESRLLISVLYQSAEVFSNEEQVTCFARAKPNPSRYQTAARS